MVTASQKRKENIAEYLLYMWQIEDLVRAYGLDIDRIKENIVDRYTNLDSEQRRQMIGWYESLIEMMRSEDAVQHGHLQMNKNVMSSLEALHRKLLQSSASSDYATEFYKTLPYIVELRAKSGDQKHGEVETCFDALYGMLMMRLQGKPVSPATAEAMKQISHFVAMLAREFRIDEEGLNAHE